jgi:hypothetical protein
MTTKLKLFYFLGIFLFATPYVFAQNTFPSTGNVGIGTVTPGAGLSFNNVTDGPGLPVGVTWYNPAPLLYGIYRTAGDWTAPNYQQLKLNWETGITLNPGVHYGKSYVEIQGGGLRVTSGKVGINTASPGAKLSFNDLNDGTNQADGITWYNPDPQAYGIYRTAGSWTAPDYQQLKLHFETGIVLNPGSAYGKSFVDIQGGGLRVTSGSVSIGATAPVAGYSLTVADGILTEKVKIALKSSSDWSDYVFAPEYRLKPLSEVETFVNENKHLPGVPSAEELVKDGGINVNEMFAKQMEKIEELTLYLIEMKKEVVALKKENQELKEHITSIK